MKKILTIFIIFLISVSCDFDLPTYNNTYEEKLTVFANVEFRQSSNNYLMFIDDIHVSLTSALEQDVQKDSLYLNNANIKITKEK